MVFSCVLTASCNKTQCGSWDLQLVGGQSRKELGSSFVQQPCFAQGHPSKIKVPWAGSSCILPETLTLFNPLQKEMFYVFFLFRLLRYILKYMGRCDIDVYIQRCTYIYIYITYTYQQINSACSRYSAAQTAAVCKCNGNYYILCKPNTCLYSLMQKEYLSLYIYIYIYIYGDSFRCQGVLGPWLVQS